MAREIERKYLLSSEEWKSHIRRSTDFAQGYLTSLDGETKSSVRIRIEGDKANINIKSLEIGLSRDEYEYSIDFSEAQKMLDTLAIGPVIKKTRHLVDYQGFTWEIDEFFGDNSGLVVAEVELPDEATQIELPAWAGLEVTLEPRYYNISLSAHPFANWSDDEKFPKA